MAQMRKATFTTTVPHLFSPISAFSAESKSYIITLCINVHETIQIYPLNFPNFNNTFISRSDISFWWSYIFLSIS